MQTTEITLPPDTTPDRRGWRLTTSGDPAARRTENKGRLWLVASYVLCPCHLPVTATVIAGVAGGTAIGSTLTANAWRLGALMALLYALALWRGFRLLRRARDAAGAVSCSPDGCAVIPAGSLDT